MDRGAWQAIVHGVAKSWIQLKQLNTLPEGRNQSDAFLEGEKAPGMGYNLRRRVASRGPHPPWKTREATRKMPGRASSR